MNDQQVLVPDWAVRLADRGYPFWEGSPRILDFDGARGVFGCGSEVLGSEIYLQIFDYRWQSGQRWGRLNQHWLDVAAVSPEGWVSQISLKKDSAVNLHAHVYRLESGKQFGKGVNLHATWTKLEAMPQQTTDGETYYVVWASYSNWADEAQVKGVENFIQDFAQGFPWLLVGEVE